MKAQRLISEIQKHTWWSEEAPAVPMFCVWMRAFVEQSKFWHPRLPTIIFCFFKDDFVFEETPEDEKLKIWDYAWRRYRRNPAQQKARYETWRKIVAALVMEGEHFLRAAKQMSDPELANSFLKFNEYIREHWRMTWVQESADIFTTYELPKLLKRELPRRTVERLNDLAFTLALPLKLSFMEEARQEMLGLLIKWYPVILRNKALARMPTDFRTALCALAQKYVWLRSNYRAAYPVRTADLWREFRAQTQEKSLAKLIAELRSIKTKVKRTKHEQTTLYRTVRLSKKIRSAFDLLSFWSAWIDERKRAALVADYYFEEYAKEIARRTKRNIWEVKYMSMEEVESALVDRAISSHHMLTTRRRLSCYVAWKRGRTNHEYTLVGKDARQLWQAIFKKGGSQEIKGQVASAPVAKLRGKVQVVLDVSKARFKPGSILVTTMTRPEFMPLMRQASAIITDEGGLTCHAAIVSRELNIPCIIGTKMATKVLKDGERVEVDATKGVVRKL